MSKMPEVHPHATKEIACPVLGSLVHQGQVHLRPDGTVPLAELAAAWRSLGLSAPLRAGLQGLGYFANSPLDVLHNARTNELNALDLRGGMLSHPADSGVLTRGEFDEAAFEALVSHAEDEVMTIDAFARTIAANVRRDLQPGRVIHTVLRGMNSSVLEFTGLLALFGRRDRAHGKLGIPVDELRALYEHKHLPQAHCASLRDTLAVHALMTIKVDAALAASVKKSLTRG